MQEYLEFAFPFAIVPASRPRIGRNPRTGKIHGRNLPKYSAFLKEAGFYARTQMKGSSPLKGPLCVVMNFFIERPKSVNRELPCVVPDLTNYAKAAEDMGNKIIWEDDSQICSLVLKKKYSNGFPHFEIYVFTPDVGNIGRMVSLLQQD